MTDFRAPHLPSAPPAATLDESRERAVRLLTDGFAYDLITVEEFERRLGQLGRADTPRAMGALVADLGPSAHTGLALASSAALAPAEGRIVGIMSQTRREGLWHAPQRLRVMAVMSEVRIDLRHAVLPPSFTIDMSAIMANVHVIVPPGMVVDFDVTPIMATSRNDVRAQRISAYVQPQVRVVGTAIMSEVRVRVKDPGR
jgi:hypothetical protein